MGNRLGRAAYWAIPVLVLLGVHVYGLAAWFQQDDFVWLGLQADSPARLWHALVTPTPHGTLRPFGDRGFFILWKALFGLNALAFKLAVFAFAALTLGVMSALTVRLTKSRLAGFLAPIIWVVSPALAIPLAWISGVYQVLGALCFTLALYWWVRYTETGLTRFFALQWVVFAFGFGVIESIVVYPVMAAAHAFVCARGYVKRTLGMFAASAVFLAAHFMLAPKQTTGVYAAHVDWSMVTTLLEYCRLIVPTGGRAGSLAVGVGLLAAACGFAVWQARRANRLPLLFLAWSFAPLAVVLPLRDHVTDYYMTIPLVGAAMLAADAVSRVPRISGRVATLLVLAIGLTASGTVAVRHSAFWYARSKRIEQLVTAVVHERQRSPDRVFLLENVDADLFWGQLYYRPFRVFGVTDVFLEGPPPAWSRDVPFPEDFFVSRLYAAQLARAGRLTMLRVDGGQRVTDVTRERVPLLPKLEGPDARVVLSNTQIPGLLEGWLAAEPTGRWTGNAASLTIHAPVSADDSLYVAGFCPPAALRGAPIRLTVSLDQERQSPVEVSRTGRFSFSFRPPASAIGRASMRVDLEVDPTFRLGASSPERGLFFTSIEVR